jgi:hypothetical protein
VSRIGAFAAAQGHARRFAVAALAGERDLFATLRAAFLPTLPVRLVAITASPSSRLSAAARAANRRATANAIASP